MDDLKKMSCESCEVGAPLATAKEIEAFMSQLPQWERVEENGITRLRKTYTFKDFNAALAFTNKVGALAEEQDHHPDILTAWGRVTVTWWTHKIKGLHINDFVMAAKTETLAEN